MLTIDLPGAEPVDRGLVKSYQGSQRPADEMQLILNNEIGEEDQYRLVTDMIKGARMFNEFNETLEKLKKLAVGFKEGLLKKGYPGG